MKRNILFLLSLCMLLLTCSDGNDPIKEIETKDPFITLKKSNIDLSSEAQSVELEVKTNIDYEIIIPEDAKDWVSHSTTRALRTETVVLDIAQNKDYDERTVEVVVKDKKTDLQETVSIKQAAPQLIYVSKKGDNNNSGLSWQTAKRDLQAALDIADHDATILISSGVYLPTKAKDSNDPRSKSFFINKSNISIVGGFKGDESEISQRSITDIDNNSFVEPWEMSNETILSGDIDNEKDLWEYRGDSKYSEKLWDISNNDNNAYQLFSTNNNGSLTLIDGVTLANANANGFTQKQNVISGNVRIEKVQNSILKNNYSEKTLERGIVSYSNSLIESNYSNTDLIDFFEISNCVIRNNRSYRYWTLNSEYDYNNYSKSPGINNSIIYNNMNMVINSIGGNLLIFNNHNLQLTESTNNITLANNKGHSLSYYSPITHSNSILWVMNGTISEDTFSGVNYKFSTSALVNTFKPKYGENNISISIENDGNDSNVNYPRFNNPSKFVGCAQNMTQLEELYKSNWELSKTSSCIDYGYKK